MEENTPPSSTGSSGPDESVDSSTTEQQETVVFSSSRFGELEVPKESVITFPKGMIGFGEYTKYVMLDYKPPFSWLHSIDAPNLAFVVVDGSSLENEYDSRVVREEKICDFQTEDEYAILLIATIRQQPSESTVNLKAPLFVNVRNRCGVQIIFDNPKYQTRWPLWSEPAQMQPEQGQAESPPSQDTQKDNDSEPPESNR